MGPRPSPVMTTVQTLWSPSRSRAQRENQSRSPTDRATPSSARSPPSLSLSSLPSPSRSPLLQTSQTSSTPSCLPLNPIYPLLTLHLHSLNLPCPPTPAPDHHPVPPCLPK